MLHGFLMILATLAALTFMAASGEHRPASVQPSGLAERVWPVLAPTTAWRDGDNVTLAGVFDGKVVGESMRPVILDGYRLLYRPLRAGEPRVGQVIVFDATGCLLPTGQQLVAHTVIKLDGTTILTAGLSNDMPDLCGALTTARVRGVVTALVGPAG